MFDSDLLPYNVIIMAEEQFELLQEWGQGSPAHLESDNLVLQANAKLHNSLRTLDTCLLNDLDHVVLLDTDLTSCIPRHCWDPCETKTSIAI